MNWGWAWGKAIIIIKKYIYISKEGWPYQCMILNISKDCHLGYLNLKIYSPIKFCHSHIFQWYWKKKKKMEISIAMWSTRLRSHSPKEFFITLAIGLLLKIEHCHTSCCCLTWCLSLMWSLWRRNMAFIRSMEQNKGNTLISIQNGWHFAHIFKFIFLHENCCV